jgi:hypothetical protein
MTVAPQEITGGQTPERTLEFPPLRSVDELDRHVEGTYGTEVLTALKDSTSDQADVLRQLHESGLNGDAERVNELYNLHTQEFARKESLLGKTWDTTKEVVSAPFRYAWSSFKERPITTTLVGASLILGGTGAYLYSVGALESYLASIGAAHVGSFFSEAAAELAPLTPDLPIVPGAGEAGLPGGLPVPEGPPAFGV